MAAAATPTTKKTKTKTKTPTLTTKKTQRRQRGGRGGEAKEAKAEAEDDVTLYFFICVYPVMQVMICLIVYVAPTGICCRYLHEIGYAFQPDPPSP